MASEVAAYTDVNQFDPGKSEMKCGYYAVWQNHYAGQHTPAGSAQDIASRADNSYIKYDGPDVASNGNGMSLSALYSTIQDSGGHWQNIYPDALPGLSQGNLKANIREWVKGGYPVIIAVDEGTITDMELGSNPYSWGPRPGQYTHIITVTGLQENGIDFLCRDTANIAPNGVRPGPRRYAATPMEIVSATIFVPSWKPRPASATAFPTSTPAPSPAPSPAPATDWKKQAETALASLQEALAHL